MRKSHQNHRRQRTPITNNMSLQQARSSRATTPTRSTSVRSSFSESYDDEEYYGEDQQQPSTISGIDTYNDLYENSELAPNESRGESKFDFIHGEEHSSYGDGVVVSQSFDDTQNEDSHLYSYSLKSFDDNINKSLDGDYTEEEEDEDTYQNDADLEVGPNNNRGDYEDSGHISPSKSQRSRQKMHSKQIRNTRERSRNIPRDKKSMKSEKKRIEESTRKSSNSSRKHRKMKKRRRNQCSLTDCWRRLIDKLNSVPLLLKVIVLIALVIGVGCLLFVASYYYYEKKK